MAGRRRCGQRVREVGARAEAVGAVPPARPVSGAVAAGVVVGFA